ncbi:MAG TPA: PP2C family protein-serine/threonine phosphatase, partial [Candidatus Kapabacteria bacterium]|nr:PP2C family protein-serine/threonine phosphatase [Candidatus Kapabacteria bacterium]
MAHVKGIVLSLAGMAKSPSDFLLKVNNALYGNMEKHAYITMSVCMFDTDAKELVLVRGGHCPTFLKQNRAVAVVTPKGLGIGLAANSLFVPTLQEMHIPYSEGDIAYFFTDGVSEAKNTIDEEFGYEPILDVLRGVQDGETSKVINETIMHEVRSFVGTAPQHDDITSVVVRCVQSKAQNSLVTSSSNGEYQTVER